MEALEIARWQFGITTVYHFMMVPLTIGLGLVVAVMQTLWHRTGKEEYLRMTKFWGKLFLINFIMGVATGIVQEFQFGMAWSEYSRFVGDVFGAPLAHEDDAEDHQQQPADVERQRTEPDEREDERESAEDARDEVGRPQLCQQTGRPEAEQEERDGRVGQQTDE